MRPILPHLSNQHLLSNHFLHEGKVLGASISLPWLPKEEPCTAMLEGQQETSGLWPHAVPISKCGPSGSTSAQGGSKGAEEEGGLGQQYTTQHEVETPHESSHETKKEPRKTSHILLAVNGSKLDGPGDRRAQGCIRRICGVKGMKCLCWLLFSEGGCGNGLSGGH